MLTEARIREELKPTNGVDWITALRAPKIHALFESGLLHLEDFQHQDWVELACRDYPGERLVACRNPHLAKQRASKREELLKATEQELDKIVAATVRSSGQLQAVHSFQSLLADLATVVKNTVQPKPLSIASFDKITQLTPVQQQAFDLLGLQL